MNDNWYIVDDLDGFILSSRKLIFNNFGKTKDSSSDINSMFAEIKPEEQDEFDTILTQEESLIIAKGFLKKQLNKKTKEVRYVLTDEVYIELLESMNDRMVSNTLNSLVNKGYLESGFDEESNDFVFWVKDENDQKEKPETD